MEELLYFSLLLRLCNDYEALLYVYIYLHFCNNTITIDGKPIDQVTNMAYLGHMVSDDGRNGSGIKRRIKIARNAFINMSKMLASRGI